MNYTISQKFDLSKEVKDLQYKRYDEDKLNNRIMFKLSESSINFIKNYQNSISNSVKKEKSINVFIRNLILNYIDLITNKNIHNKVKTLDKTLAKNTGKQYMICFLLTNQQWRVLHTRQMEIGAKNVNILIKNVVLNWIDKESK